MDQIRFDNLVRSLTISPSRRHLLRALVATGLGLGAARLPQLAVASQRPAGEATALATTGRCQKTGVRCQRDEQCCSGTCRRNDPNGEKRCRRTAGARGCTIEDGCLKVPCPGDPNGRCAVTVDGKPFCLIDGACFACASNQDCDDEFNVTGARCVECANECDANTNFRACVAYAPEGEA